MKKYQVITKTNVYKFNNYNEMIKQFIQFTICGIPCRAVAVWYGKDKRAINDCAKLNKREWKAKERNWAVEK